MGADDRDLSCKGAVYIRINGIPTKALVTSALKNELIVGWPDLMKLGVIGDSFPRPIRAIHLQENLQEIQSDNGPQFRGPFKDYCREIGAEHVPSSPYNPASNGLAESGVKSAKTLLSKCAEDGTQLSQAIHAWRNIPRADGLAPSDLLFGFRQCVPNRPPATRAFSFVDRHQGHKERVTRKQLHFETAGGTPVKELEQGSSALLQGGDKRWNVPAQQAAPIT